MIRDRQRTEFHAPSPLTARPRTTTRRRTAASVLLAAAAILSSRNAPAQQSSADEGARIQQYIDARYRPSDVRHSFHTMFGETIDCIEHDAQPSIRSRIAQGLPTPGPMPDNGTAPIPFGGFDGSLDDEGRSRACPDTTVPQIRVTAAEIHAAGGLDAYLRARRHKAPPPFAGRAGTASTSPPPGAPAWCSPTGPDLPNFAHVYASVLPSAGETFAEADGTLAIYSPTLRSAAANNLLGFEDHSLAQLWLFAGSGFNAFGCTCTNPDCLETVEVGWIVDPLMNSDGTAHLFIFATKDGYSTGCYNGGSGPGCVTWDGASGAAFTPGMQLTPGVAGGSSRSLTFEIAFVTLNGQVVPPINGWGVYVGGRYIGAYLATSFTNGMASGQAQSFQIGGEVADSVPQATSQAQTPFATWVTPMGTGADPAAESGQAGYAGTYEACDFVGSSSCNINFQLIDTVPSAYRSWAPTPSATSFYFGNTPSSFLGQNYGYSWSPTSPADWDPGYYKGECGFGTSASGAVYGQPVVGLSAKPSNSEADSVRCGSASIASSNACITRVFDSSDPLPIGDWDSGYVKAECPSSYYVQGISQSTSGSLHKLLCCPFNGSEELSGAKAPVENAPNCYPQVVYGGNSSQYVSPDWDFGDYKANCSTQYDTRYVAGVSEFGSTGRPHAILCCVQ